MNITFFVQNKRYVFLFGGLFLLISFFFMLSFVILRPTQTPDTSSTLPDPRAFPSSSSSKDPNDPYNERYNESMKKINQEEKGLIQQDEKVAAFINKLPERGIYFTASYDIGTNSVTVTIPRDKSGEGNAEFDAYLTANGIENRSWIQNLTVTYRDRDPLEH